MRHIDREYYNYQNGAPIFDEYTVKHSDKPKTSDLMAMLEVCDDPSTLLKIKEILSKKIGLHLKPRIQSRIDSSISKANSQFLVVSDDCCKINKPDYTPVIDTSSSNLNIYPLQLTITAKRIVCEITVYDFKTPKSGPKPDKLLVTLDLMNKNKNSNNLLLFCLFKPDILLHLKDFDHQAALQLKEFFFNMETVHKTKESYKGDQMMEHPNPKNWSSRTIIRWWPLF